METPNISEFQDKESFLSSMVLREDYVVLGHGRRPSNLGWDYHERDKYGCHFQFNNYGDHGFGVSFDESWRIFHEHLSRAESIDAAERIECFKYRVRIGWVPQEVASRLLSDLQSDPVAAWNHMDDVFRGMEKDKEKTWHDRRGDMATIALKPDESSST